MQIVAKRMIAADTVKRFFIHHLETTQVVLSGGIFHYAELEGFGVMDEDEEILGLGTYKVTDHVCQIISLNSVHENQGVGSSLLYVIENIAKEKHCHTIEAITTNDNLQALKFFQKRGYAFSEIVRNAVDESRKIKPEIPFYSVDGIPIRDEIVLDKYI
ncbi:GNAT family N-acetyltransferase [Peribacillus muralis]|uniref:GNAT family N-acetyltransferase n=1 Tax=Peribacillus muralis TaxID=264697 RepID=UPI00070E2739|nr:GNAT family N-acetyltransferase [Peribacillus muralis]MCK1994262.1 GNAT family N-acetyltransferase [Peribacillus muralis]MCK2014953.1 GNAT family N-acetyltransferase [Peribacillus muralis]